MPRQTGMDFPFRSQAVQRYFGIRLRIGYLQIRVRAVPVGEIKIFRQSGPDGFFPVFVVGPSQSKTGCP